MKVRMRYVANKKARLPIPDEIIKQFKKRPMDCDVKLIDKKIVAEVI